MKVLDVVRFVITVILLVAFIVLSYEAFEKYFRRDIGTVTSVDEVGNFTFPSITICPVEAAFGQDNANMTLKQANDRLRNTSREYIISVTQGKAK